MTAEQDRLTAATRREQDWKRWGTYLSERQWGTVREDYSADGSSWDAFSHDRARSRAYRWGEDGLLGLCDRKGRLCFALALWNERDPILKERLFGLSNSEGNHGEDVKECYFYLDATPTHSYCKALYKYPQAEFPYAQLVAENQRRTQQEREYELLDTGIFDENRYFDVGVEYAKASPNDILIRVTIVNHSSEPAPLHVLPTLWFQNTWSWGRTGEGYESKPRIDRDDTGLVAEHSTLGQFHLVAEPLPGDHAVKLLFTDNETNTDRLYGTPNANPYVKDAFGSYLIQGNTAAVNPAEHGTKAAVHYPLQLAPGETIVLKLRLFDQENAPATAFGEEFDRIFEQRIQEADAFYAQIPGNLKFEEHQVVRQACAGLLWSKQFYYYGVADWLEGDPTHSADPKRKGLNHDWAQHLYNRDVISMPDKWEYPWYATWDLAFHTIPLCKIDPDFAKGQLILMLREWYMHPNGAIPAYEYGFSDTNPPVHAWACWRVYKLTAPQGQRDRVFLARVFQKLLLNFTWWVNRQDTAGKNIFAGGFLGMDNIGVFDRSHPLPIDGQLEQADATGWMAFYCSTMLSMALELATEDPAYEDVASKFFEHFMAISSAINTFDGTGLWDEQDGFYYDRLRRNGVTDGGEGSVPLRVRSLVGLLPLLTAQVIDLSVMEALPAFSKRMRWFLENRPEQAQQISCLREDPQHARRLLSIPTHDRFLSVLRYLLDENEFLSPYGIRSLSKVHQDNPYSFWANDREYRVEYTPGESTNAMFGGNSNWRGPIWFPLNYLIIEALERYYYFYGDSLQVECPTGSGQQMNLQEVAQEISTRLGQLFVPDERGHCPWQGDQMRYSTDPHWQNLTLFNEYFDAETGRGLGASHQTGWTALVARLTLGNRIGIAVSGSH
ncbi:glucosidase [Chamaesiphon sp.]|uniref:MGH1-like glycoside hydrolase domain-containing protein n=1 Tax=Chamaesiphon sp. TaxID=2814140 RepID=UPI0035933302